MAKVFNRLLKTMVEASACLQFLDIMHALLTPDGSLSVCLSVCLSLCLSLARSRSRALSLSNSLGSLSLGSLFVSLLKMPHYGSTKLSRA